MNDVLRKAVFAVPFACLAALAVHVARFGDDHAFGGEGNEGLVAAAVGGSVAVALTILHAFLTAGTTTSTGTIAAARARERLPNALTLFGSSAAIYYGIEALEGNGIEIGLPTLLLAASAALLAAALRAVVALVAGVVARIVSDLVALLDRREHLVGLRSPQARPIVRQLSRAARRFGRAPPNERLFF
jgi:hypothetical protein